MADPNPKQDATSAIGAVELGDFDTLLKKEFKPKTDEAKEAVERAVRTRRNLFPLCQRTRTLVSFHGF